MTEEKERPESVPPPAASDAPYLAKRRIPTEEPVRSVGASGIFAKGAIGVYLTAGLVCLGIAAYMAFGEHRPLLSVAVIAPAIGGVWFLLRLFMVAQGGRKD